MDDNNRTYILQNVAWNYCKHCAKKITKWYWKEVFTFKSDVTCIQVLCMKMPYKANMNLQVNFYSIYYSLVSSSLGGECYLSLSQWALATAVPSHIPTYTTHNAGVFKQNWCTFGLTFTPPLWCWHSFALTKALTPAIGDLWQRRLYRSY